jgi:hypothetical protein
MDPSLPSRSDQARSVPQRDASNPSRSEPLSRYNNSSYYMEESFSESSQSSAELPSQQEMFRMFIMDKLKTKKQL